MHTALLLMYNLFKIKLKQIIKMQSWMIAESSSIEVLPKYNKMLFANI